ncbi:ribosome assembly RNA-binding protein YhbY [Myxococcaceae bacterium GXIMD 01537]
MGQKEKHVPLTGKQRRALRAMGHHLEPVVIVGQSGVTDGVVAAIEQALHDHELIKVKINEGPEGRHEAAERLATATGAELAQLLGRTALFFKKRKEDSEFDDL